MSDVKPALLEAKLRYGALEIPWIPAAIILGLIAALYWEVVPAMAEVWLNDDAYSHGLLIPPLAAYVAWLQKDWITAAPARLYPLGLLATASGCFAFLLGRLGAEFFLTRVSLVVILAGMVLTFWGPERLARLTFPLLMLASMVPLPAIVYNQLAAPLQLFSSSVSSSVLEMIGIPVFRDDNVMHLAEISLGVAEACSGLRSILSLTVLALIVGFFVCSKVTTRVGLFFLAFPVAIAVNVLRIVITALLARENREWAEGFFHTFSGWIVFLVGFGMLYLLAAGLAHWEGGRGPREALSHE